jgi:hypothetical protein
MADEQTAETLAPETTTTTPETPVNDGIIDLDAQEEVKEESEEGQSEEAKAAAAKAAEEAAETEKKKLSGAQRAKLREQRLRDELSAREREIEELREPRRRPDRPAIAKRRRRKRKTSTGIGSHTSRHLRRLTPARPSGMKSARTEKPAKPLNGKPNRLKSFVSVP